MNEKKDVLSKVIAKAWKDPAFKKKLLQDPKAALKEMGKDIPPGVDVKVVEDTPKSITIVLPTSPVKAAELSERELEQVAGAGFTNTCFVQCMTLNNRC